MEVNDNIIIYEYMITDRKFVKYIHEAKRNGGAFEFKKNGNRRTVCEHEFDIVKNSRVLLFEDNEEKAKQMLFEHYENQAEKLKKNLSITKKNLKILNK